MTAVQVEGIVVVVVSVKNLDSIDEKPVAGEIVLHPAAAVPKCDIPDDDILTTDDSQQVRTGDTLVIP